MAKWVMDPDHSVAAFVVRHMMIADVRGQFNAINGRVEFDPANIAGSSVEAEIDVKGIYTGIAKRDAHLRSPDFFDVERYPKMIFKSTSVHSIKGNLFTVTGDLTIRGVTRQVDLNVAYSGPVKDPFDEGGMSMGFSASTVINREDYGVAWNADMEGGLVVSREVRIFLDIEADMTAG